MYGNYGYYTSRGGASKLPSVGDKHNGYTYTKDKIWNGPGYVSPNYKGTHPNCPKDSHGTYTSSVLYGKK